MKLKEIFGALLLRPETEKENEIVDETLAAFRKGETQFMQNQLAVVTTTSDGLNFLNFSDAVRYELRQVARLCPHLEGALLERKKHLETVLIALSYQPFGELMRDHLVRVYGPAVPVAPPTVADEENAPNLTLPFNR